MAKKKKVKKASDMIKKYYKPETEIGKELKETMVAISEEKEDYPKSISKEAVTKAVEDGDLVKRDVAYSNKEVIDFQNALHDKMTSIISMVVGLEQRIDCIVTAIGKAKSVKGL